MSVLDLINKLGAQVNPFDNGKTWSNPQGSAPVRPAPAPAPVLQFPTTPPPSRGAPPAGFIAPDKVINDPKYGVGAPGGDFQYTPIPIFINRGVPQGFDPSRFTGPGPFLSPSPLPNDVQIPQNINGNPDVSVYSNRAGQRWYENNKTGERWPITRPTEDSPGWVKPVPYVGDSNVSQLYNKSRFINNPNFPITTTPQLYSTQLEQAPRSTI